MNTENWALFLRGQRNSAATVAPERTGLSDAADDNLAMVTAYLQDGDVFLASGDLVNAFAAYCYGAGWLHCGAAVGLITVQAAACPFADPVEPLPARFRDQLDEKTARYARLLATARAAVRPAAEEGTVLCRLADRLYEVTSCYAGQGERFLTGGRAEDALACFSYGHGWLDAAVRAGLFCVTSDRDLFTI